MFFCRFVFSMLYLVLRCLVLILGCFWLLRIFVVFIGCIWIIMCWCFVSSVLFWCSRLFLVGVLVSCRFMC